jgi:hypothetical protein
LAGTAAFERALTWEVLCFTAPPFSQVSSPPRKSSSSKFSLQSVEYFTPALVREPLRLSMPTRPGQVPDQLATFRMGPRCESNPWSRWCEYCQTHSATMSGAAGSRPANTSMPSFCEPMKPCFSFGL